MKRLILLLVILVAASIMLIQQITPNSKKEIYFPLKNHVCDTKIEQISPNTICFDVATEGTVCIEIFNILGQKVKCLADGHFKEGYYCLEWNGQDDNGHEVDNSVYFCRMKTDYCKTTKKIVLLK